MWVKAKESQPWLLPRRGRRSPWPWRTGELHGIPGDLQLRKGREGEVRKREGGFPVKKRGREGPTGVAGATLELKALETQGTRRVGGEQQIPRAENLTVGDDTAERGALGGMLRAAGSHRKASESGAVGGGDEVSWEREGGSLERGGGWLRSFWLGSLSLFCFYFHFI